jgi:hypothetical protein
MAGLEEGICDSANIPTARMAAKIVLVVKYDFTLHKINARLHKFNFS